MDPQLSVVVPTRDRPRRLGRCLAALGRQQVRLEAIVVDDGSCDREAVIEAASAHAGTRLLRTPGRGAAAARNLGVHAASAELIAFCDDDCEPQAGWAGRLAGAALDSGVAAGQTVSPPGASALVAAAQAITNHLQLDSRDPSGRLAFAPTCNLAARREHLVRLPFDASYARAGGEDRDWCARAVAAGLTIEYVPEAVVVHSPDLDLPGFIRQQYHYGRGAARFRAGAKGRRIPSPRFYAGLVRAGFGGGKGTGLAVIAAQGAAAAGVVTERAARTRVT